MTQQEQFLLLEFCPLCLKVVVGDPYSLIHQGKRTHSSCFNELERRFPTVIRRERPFLLVSVSEEGGRK